MIYKFKYTEKCIKVEVKMKKRINITIDEEIYNWLKSEQYNISGWIRAIIQKVYTEKCINIKPKNKELEPTFPVEIDKDFENAGLVLPAE